MVIQEIVERSDRLRSEFDGDGYLSLAGFFDCDEVAELCESKERFIRDVVPTMPQSEVYYDDKRDHSTLKQLQQLWKHDSFFAQMMEVGRNQINRSP
jgi:phytanoyl-CoA hydroxylase